MSTTNLVGLSLASNSGSLAIPAAAIAWNWFYAYCVLASRNFKQFYGIDHQGSPRQDLSKYGTEAVKAGKLTQAQLDQMQRLENASANSTEGFILFTASVLFALIADIPRTKLVTGCIAYSTSRIVYGLIYIFVADNLWAQARGIAWWCCNCSCFYLLWNGARSVA